MVMNGWWTHRNKANIWGYNEDVSGDWEVVQAVSNAMSNEHLADTHHKNANNGWIKKNDYERASHHNKSR